SYDLTVGKKRIQVKARLVSEPLKAGQTQTSPFRSWDFQSAAFVLLRDTSYEVVNAVLAPVEVVREYAAFRKHVNGWVLFVRPPLTTDARVTDITEQLRTAARED